MDQLLQIPLTMCAGKAGLTAGTTTTLTTATTVAYSLQGKAYSKSATSNQATPTTDYATGVAFVAVPVNYGSVFAIGYDSGGTLRVVQGQVQALDVSGAFIKSPLFGPLPDGMCPVGYLVVKVGSTGSAWTFGSSNLAGPPTGVTLAWQDCFTLPARPQVS